MTTQLATKTDASLADLFIAEMSVIVDEENVTAAIMERIGTLGLIAIDAEHEAYKRGWADCLASFERVVKQLTGEAA